MRGADCICFLGEKDETSLNAPRLFIKCDAGSKIEIVEEFMTLGTSSDHLSMPVCEIDLREDAELVHHYTQLDGPAACHMKTTLIRQAARSKYSLVECSVGARLSRHDLGIDQVCWFLRSAFVHECLSAGRGRDGNRDESLLSVWRHSIA